MKDKTPLPLRIDGHFFLGSFATSTRARARVMGCHTLPVNSTKLARPQSHSFGRQLIVDLALKEKLPILSNFRETTEAGGVLSYGASRTDLFGRAAIYAGKILKGSKPSDLPIEQLIKYELVINLKTAKDLNLIIPRDVLLIADEVIE